MKSTRQIVLAAFMLLVAKVCFAYDFESGGIYYNITSNSVPYTVEVTNGTNAYSGVVTIPSTVTYNNNVYTVSSIGYNAFFRCTGLTSVNIPNSVTSIGQNAFRNCSSLNSITIPNSVTSIGRDAFLSCTGLTRTNYTGTIAQWCNIDFMYNPVLCSRNLYINNQLVTNLVIPNTVDTIKQLSFYGDTCITSVTIPNSVTNIGGYVFCGCTGLTSVTIPNSVTSIGGGAFYNCTGLIRTNYNGTIAQWCDIDFLGEDANPVSCSRNLYINNQLITNLVIPNTIDTIKYFAFCGDTCITSITIPNSVTCIGNSAFFGCTGLTSVTIPNSVTIIGNQAFSYCSGLTSVTIGNSVASIGVGVFSYCTGLTSVTIPNSVTSIGYAAFLGDTLLSSITIPNSVTSIGRNAFYDCTNLTSVTIGNSVTKIERSAFNNCTSLTRTNYAGTIAQWCDIDFFDLYANPVSRSKNLYINNQLITNLVIPNTVDTIKQYSFCGDLSITSVTIPNSVRIIDSSAFYGCTSLSSLTMGNSVASIGYGAFRNCTGLTTVTIPNSVASIGDGAFYGCTDLTSLTIGDSVTGVGANASIGSSAFYGCTNLTSVTIGNSVTRIAGYAFYNCTGLTRTNYTGTIAQWCNINFGSGGNPVFYSHNLYINNQLITNLVIPNTVDTIKPTAFCGDTCITSVTIGNSVTSIGYNAFNGCTAVTTVNFNADSCVYVYNNYPNSPHCWNNLRTLNIGNNVKFIPNDALYGCTNLTSVTFHRANTMIGSGAFRGLPVALPIHIPCGSSAWYINKLPNFSNFIEELQYIYSVASQDTLKGNVTTITSPTCNNNSAWTISATSNTGYTFSRWNDGNTQNPRTLTVTQDTTLIAYFMATTPQWYRFSAVSEDTLKGTVQILAQPSQSSPQATFVALPNIGYTFSRWSDGNTQNPRTLTVTQDTFLVACFTSSTQQWYNFNVVSEDANKGTVQILAQPSQSSPQATFVALPNTGYTFSRWSDGNTQNPRSITVTQDTILIAFFTSNHGISEVESSKLSLYPNPASEKVVLEGIDNEVNVFVSNAVGKIVKRLENVSGSVTFSVANLPKGIYYVRVGTAVRKLVVE